jgi:hypothetical protein
MILFSYTAALIVLTVFCILPSMVLWALLRIKRDLLSAVKLISGVTALFVLEYFFGLWLIARLIDPYVAVFASQNINLFTCLWLASWMLNAPAKVRRYWVIFWFLILLIPGGYWTFTSINDFAGRFQTYR